MTSDVPGLESFLEAGWVVAATDYSGLGTAGTLDVTRAGAAGSELDALFVGDLGHMKAGFASAPAVFTWLQQRFAGVPIVSTCGTVLPVAPIAP